MIKIKTYTEYSNQISKSKEKLSEYQKFFLSKLEEFGVKSITELSDELKSKFFNEIEEEWDKEK